MVNSLESLEWTLGQGMAVSLAAAIVRARLLKKGHINGSAAESRILE
jgi:hypothetical protein